ncbi:MAG TPA: hypothetical protein VEL07_03400 [Planctomycetota bacterium]|nr:hypothetical protein [Planctomycetota bacterium]
MFSGPVQRVAGTRIFARSASAMRQILIYQMRVTAREPVAMVLPLPVPAETGDDAVRFIDLGGYPEFFADLDAGFPKRQVRARGHQGFDLFGGEEAKPLRVHVVGSFVASFVPTRADFARLDARFRLPDDVWSGLGKYDDFGFAVFQLSAGEVATHPMAFEYPRREAGALFFPTTHVHDGTVPEDAEFDHALYCQPIEGERFAITGWDESPQPPARTVAIARSAETVRDDRHCYRFTIDGKHPNRDLLLKPR